MLREVNFIRLLTTITFVACSSVTVLGQDLVANFSARQPSGRYSFASWTPKTLGELLKGNAQQDSTNIVGHLFLPPGTEKTPAVVLMQVLAAYTMPCWNTGRSNSTPQESRYFRSIRSVRGE